MRLFVAIELSKRTRSALQGVGVAVSEECTGVRWIPAERLHLTIKFLGEVPDGDVVKVADAVARTAAGSAPFEMEIAGCGCFPPRGPVRIVWAGIKEESGVLQECVETLESELEELGFARERRRFSPHLTIGRVREDHSGGRLRSADESHGFDSLEESVSSLTLMSSVLSPRGPSYTPASTARLGRAGH